MPTGDDLASIAFTYDPNNNPTSIVETWTGTPTSRQTARSYDAFDRLQGVTDRYGRPRVGRRGGAVLLQGAVLRPGVGRFLTEDPADGEFDVPPSLHRYLYAYANPALFTDADGRWPRIADFVQAATAYFEFHKSNAKALTKTALGVLDLISLGDVSAIKKQIQTFQNIKGSFIEKADAAGKVSTLRDRLHVVTLGFSDAPNKVQHLKDIIGVTAAQSAGTHLGEGVTEGDANKVLQAVGEVSQSFVQMGTLAEGGASLARAAVGAARSGVAETGIVAARNAVPEAGGITESSLGEGSGISTAPVPGGVEASTTAADREAAAAAERPAIEAEVIPEATPSVAAEVTAESPQGAGVEVGGTIARRSVEAATDTPSGWQRFQKLSEEGQAGEDIAPNLGSKPFALGLKAYLNAFAEARGATTWKNFADPTNWKAGVIEKLADPNTMVHFNLEGVEVWPGVTRAAAGRGGATDWELLQVQQNPQWWDTIQFWRGEAHAANPFE